MKCVYNCDVAVFVKLSANIFMKSRNTGFWFKKSFGKLIQFCFFHSIKTAVWV